MKKIETLAKTKWVALNRITYPEMNIQGYDYLHEVRTNGQGLLVLPYRIVNGKREFLLRIELCPAWNTEQHFVCGLTGGVENNDPLQSAVTEVEEETGYVVDASEMIALGTCFGNKNTDTTYHLYSVDLTDKVAGEAVGDGNPEEEIATSIWKTNFDDCVDSLVHIAFYKLVRMNK